MAYISYYRPYFMANRDEQSNAAYDNLTKRFNDCNCNNSIPSANITESEKFYRIEMAMPGVDKSRIEIKHENQLLTVSVKETENQEQEQTEEKQYYHREYDYTVSSRSFRTGDKIDADQITAQYENGILTIVLPKKEEFAKKLAQTITVQ
jgi:HSP20 family protein